MSIYIGNTPIYQPQTTNFNIRSLTNSNIISLGSETSNVFMRMGDYIIGQQRTSNALEFRILNNLSQPIATFGNNEIRLLQPLTTTGTTQFNDEIILRSNLTVGTVVASNIFINNGVKNVISLDTEGNIYLDGNLNFGTNSSNYQLYLNSNIFVGGSITAGELYTPRIGNNSNFQSFISLTSNTIRLAADVVQIDNLNILGVNNFETIRVRDDSFLDGEISASNLVLYNKTSTSDPNRNALRIIQKLNAGEYADFRVGNPIAVYADFKGGLTNESIFQVTPVGQLLLGTNSEVTGSDRINYLIQANIPAQRSDLIEGFLDYKNSNIDKDRFTVNKNGLLAIGKHASDNGFQNSMLDIINNYHGDEPFYVKPTSMITLTNKFNSNALPYLKCVNEQRSNIFQITSNGTICFYNTPLNTSYYDIESRKTALFQAVETDRIYNSNNLSISFEQTTLSNISSVVASNITSEYANILFATIQNLNAPNLEISLPYFESYNFNSEIRLLTDQFAITAYNVAINANADYFQTINRYSLSRL